MIKFKDIEKIYPPKTVALKNINLEINAGEFVSIVGQSGTGKTTLIKLLTAEERATRGKITIGDWDITKIRQGEVPMLRRQIGVIFQDFKLLPKKTIFENVAFALAVMLLLILSNFFGNINLPLGVIGHEGSTIIVIISGLRLLR